MTIIQDLYQQLAKYSVSVHEYSDEWFDVAFDIITAESGIAGIADQILSGTKPSKDQMVVLDKKLLDGTTWLLLDGRSCDLIKQEILLRHARTIVALQGACKEHLQGA